MNVTNAELQSQLSHLDSKVDERHATNSQAFANIERKIDALIELGVSQKLQAQLIQQLGDKSKEHDTFFIETFKRLAKVESVTGWHSAIWKVVGVVLLAALGGFGWLFVQMKEFYQYEDKVETLEFIVQGRPILSVPPAQPTTAK